MCASHTAEHVRIACIGGSVTKGTGLGDPASESYPVQLAAFLQANGYPPADVRNFGQGGAGVLNKGCNPFCDTDQFGDALVFDPEVLVVLLGTNDCHKEYWGNDASLSLCVRENILASFADEEAADAIVHGEIDSSET
jgi:lysophospholipase L1-like esterase